MPLWLWLLLAILLFALIVAVISEIGDFLGWPHWMDTVVRSGGFAIFYAIASPRINRARESFKERRRLRKAQRP